MKKKLFLASVLAIIIAATSAFAGCNLVKGAKLKDITGTYELTAYSRTYESGFIPEGGVAFNDHKTNQEITMYLIVTGGSEGWVVYKSKDRALMKYKVGLSYRYDTDGENPDNVEYVEYFSGYYGSSTDTKNILHYEELALFASKDPTLSYTLPHLKLVDLQLKKDYTDNISFKRVSKKTDLSYVEDALGESPAEYAMLLDRYDGLLSTNTVVDNVYYFVDFHADTLKADIYWAEAPVVEEGVAISAEDIVPQVLMNQPVSYTTSGIYQLDTVTIGDRTYAVPYSGSLSYSGEPAYTLGYNSYASIEDAISTSTAAWVTNYNNQHAPQPEPAE